MGYRLDDRYLATEGSVVLSGVQALARIPIEQLRRDRLAGRNTAAFVSGYPGSPLGGFDQELARALRIADDLPIVHQPAVNEELGASAVMGSQLVAARPDATVDGVVGIWYGKAPGLDRATDALRHAVFAGSSSLGGALALVGDDPAAKSSTMPSSSDAALVDLHMPILYPATIAECLELGLHGIAMSRATGLWSALKIVTPIADGTGTVRFPVLDDDPVDGGPALSGEVWRSAPSAQFLGPRMVAVEQEFHEVRSELARQYGIEHRLNRLVTNPPDPWIGIVATGFTHTEVVEALHRLGLEDLDAVAAAGIRLLHLRMPVPFDRSQIVEFAAGLHEIVVVEEKNPTLERLVRDCLYDAAVRPRVVGKNRPDGTRLLPSHGRLDADAIAPALRERLANRVGDRLAPPPAPQRELIPLTSNRTPFFCSGCPHNWGTKVPDGAVVGMGTGCHGMTLLMEPDRVGESIGITAMGNEGAQWIGMSPFVATDHVFQNFGDGTYFHSGQLAVQAAIGAGVNVTFKILYNETVAMTGGQDASHQIGVGKLARTLQLHGVARVAVTTDDTTGYRKRNGIPDDIEIRDRAAIVALQEDLASVEGVTVLIHHQACAAELRRDRKRGRAPTPTERVVINHRICEGCGDCGDVSNCLSVQPVDTPLGRKTKIDQDSCNLDLSCLHGDCPAFMTVEVDPDAVPARAISDPDVAQLQEPTLVDPAWTTVRARMAGIGGTGVVTAAQVLATAAMLAGFETDGLDQTGLSQKAGPVVSDLIITRADVVRGSNLVGRAQADVVIAFDELVAAADGVLDAARPDRTALIASTATTPTGAEVTSPHRVGATVDEIDRRLTSVTADGRRWAIDAQRAARVLTGTATTANTLLLGVAVQAGEVPIPPTNVLEAIGLNGVAVDANRAAFGWGRRFVTDSATVQAEIERRDPDSVEFTTESLDPALADRIDPAVITGAVDDGGRHHVMALAADLAAFQDEALATRFIDLVNRTARAVAGQADGASLVRAVATNFHKLLAYKDEYEVARLMLSDDGLGPARVLTTNGATLRWHLHPPMLAALGVDRKIRFDRRSRPLFHALARGKRLRGTRWDPFGRSELRRLEQELPHEYEAVIRTLLADLGEDPDAAAVRNAVAIAELPDMVRGFEDLKLRRIGEYRTALADALSRPNSSGTVHRET